MGVTERVAELGDDVGEDTADTGNVGDDVALDTGPDVADTGTVDLGPGNTPPTATAAPEVYGLAGSFTILSGSGTDEDEGDEYEFYFLVEIKSAGKWQFWTQRKQSPFLFVDLTLPIFSE